MAQTYEQQQAVHATYRKRIKEAVYALLGKHCARCGFDDAHALQIDHVKGNGKMDRGSQSRITFHRSILANPDAQKIYQILCANCNWIKRYENQEN